MHSRSSEPPGVCLATTLLLLRCAGFVKGYALIEYGTKEEAQAAIDDLDGKQLYAKPINVTWAFSTGPLQGKARR